MLAPGRIDGYAPDMQFVTIHHPKLKLESTVARSAVPAFALKGWKEGEMPSPKRAEKKSTKKETD